MPDVLSLAGCMPESSSRSIAREELRIRSIREAATSDLAVVLEDLRSSP